MNFYALRVSLVAGDPQLFIDENMSKDIISFENALYHSVDTPPKNEHGEYIYSVKVKVQEEGYGVLAGIVSKAKALHGHDKEFNRYSVDDFPPLVWFWDREQQVILVEKKTSVFSNPTAACKSFQKLSNNIVLAELGLRAEIEPVLNELDQGFWDEYDRFEFVESVSFELTPPNLFGDTEKEMKRVLKETAKNTNANKITTTFENTDKKLNLKSEGWLNNMVNWCRKGGGHWLMRGRLFGHKKQITNIESEKTAKIVVMEGKGITELTLSNYSIYDVKDIIELYRPKYQYEDTIEEQSDD